MWRRTQDSWGYSPLTQITKANVSKLKMIWTRGMGPGIMEATPLAYRGIIYLPNPSDVIQAIDGATGDQLWEYRRQLPEDIGKIFGAYSIHRNIAIYGDQIINTSADDFVYAVDAKTGKQTWENRIVDYRENSAQETSGPAHRRGQDHLGARLRAQRRTRCLRHYRARRQDRQRDLARSHHPQTGRAGQ